MTVSQKLKTIAIIVGLLVGAIVVREYVLEREARIRAEDQATATKQVVAAGNAAIQSRDQLAAANAEQLARQSAAITTPQQAARVIVSYLPQPEPAPGAPAGSVAPVQAPLATIQPEDLSAQGKKDLPDIVPGSLVLSPVQAEQIAKNDLACSAAETNLTACAQDKADLRTELAAVQKESDTWQAAARGGTRLQRLVKVAKFVACAGGGAYIGSKADKGTGAAIGGMAGVAGCSLF